MIQPEAEPVLSRVEGRVFICSKYAGDIEHNVRVAQALCRMALEAGLAPFAPHLLYTQILKDKLGEVIDVPYSPVRLVVLMLPEDKSLRHLILVRTSAGISYMISLMTLILFVVTMRVIGWPSRIGSFNVWINLPTFDPTTPSYTIVNLSASYKFQWSGSEGFVYFKLNNLTDALAYNATTIDTVRPLAPLPGRGLLVGLRMGF